MADLRAGLLLLAAGLLAACNPGPVPQEVAPDAESRPAIAPSDFVALPCAQESERPCLIVLAGGKRLMFGAPAGAGRGAEAQDLAMLEALFLFSLHPRDVEGVDEVRNRGWRAGRLDPLPVTGPEGTAQLVEGLNFAFEQPDAESFVEEGPPAGGFNAALLEHASDVTGDTLVFDSGDLKVRAVPGGASRVSYRIGYRDLEETWHELVLVPCGGAPVAAGAYELDAANRLSIGCEAAEAGDARTIAWPLSEPVFIVQTVG